jgi:methionyl-tRNA synthetase
MAAVLGTLVGAVRSLAVAVQPIIPASAEKLLALIEAGEGGAPIPQPTPLFPRLELEEEPEAAE